jgi:hypothetical protein
MGSQLHRILADGFGESQYLAGIHYEGARRLERDPRPRPAAKPKGRSQAVAGVANPRRRHHPQPGGAQHLVAACDPVTVLRAYADEV